MHTAVQTTRREDMVVTGSGARSVLMAAHAEFPAALGLRIGDRLPLQIRHCVGTAARERLYVILR
jgi:hypothetical protein